MLSAVLYPPWPWTELALTSWAAVLEHFGSDVVDGAALVEAQVHVGRGQLVHVEPARSRTRQGLGIYSVSCFTRS